MSRVKFFRVTFKRIAGHSGYIKAVKYAVRSKWADALQLFCRHPWVRLLAEGQAVKDTTADDIVHELQGVFVCKRCHMRLEEVQLAEEVYELIRTSLRDQPAISMTEGDELEIIVLEMER